MTNAMTVDVEDYFQVSAFDRVVTRASWEGRESRVSANTEKLLGIFAEHQVRATFFVLGWIAERFPALVGQIARAGHEIACHGYGHRLVYDQSPRDFREDVRRAKAVIEDASGARVEGYRAPSYSITLRSQWALDVLIEEGFRYDASIFPIRHDRYGIPDAPRHAYEMTRRAGRLLEVPPSTVRISGINFPIAGGGYFRLLPYRWTASGIRRLNHTEHKPAVFYLHPWEIDPAQPRVEVDRLSRFRHYHNLARTESRLRRLMTEFQFAPLSEVVRGRVPRAVVQTGAGESRCTEERPKLTHSLP